MTEVHMLPRKSGGVWEDAACFGWVWAWLGMQGAWSFRGSESCVELWSTIAGSCSAQQVQVPSHKRAHSEGT